MSNNHKVVTHFTNFKFNAIPHKGTYEVTWYKLYETNGREAAKGFSDAERDQFIQYVIQNSDSFLPDTTNSFVCDENEEFPFCSPSSAAGVTRTNFPENLRLRNEPALTKQGLVNRCMDIVLAGKNPHKYDLPFNAVGRIENL